MVRISGKITETKFDEQTQKMMLRGIIGKEITWFGVGIKPYFFVKSSQANKTGLKYEKCDLKYRDAKKNEYSVVKIEMDNSKDVGIKREELARRGIETFEADIPFYRRCMIDGVIEVDYGGRVAYIDIEVDDSKGFPSVAGKYGIVCITLSDGRNPEWFYVNDFNSEAEMFDAVVQWLRQNDKTILAGWNVGFDYKHIVERSKAIGANRAHQYLLACETIDLMNEYKGMVKGLETYSLEEVAKQERVGIKSRTKSISSMSKSELMDYNVNDVNLIVDIDKKYGFSELVVEVAETVGVLISDLTPIKIADTLVLRRLRELGYVAKNGGSVEERTYTGAYIKTPKSGIVENVIYLDYEGLYPNVIIHNKIDIDGFDGEVLPAILERMVSLRKKYKSMYKETGDRKYDIKQSAMKPIINAMYGCLGNKYFRYVNYESAEKITTIAREMLLKLEKVVNELFGLEVIYQDTDSAYIEVGNAVGNIREFAKIVEDSVNEQIAPYRVKVEDVFSKILFLKGSSGDVVKKRYVGITLDGEIVWRGVEKRRSDWCRLAKDVQEKVINMVFEGKGKDEILRYLYQVKKDMYDGKYDEELIIAKGYKDIGEYVANQPHVRALKKAISAGYVPVDGKIKFVYTHDDVEPVLNGIESLKGKINYKYYWDRQVYPPVKRIIDSVFGSRQIQMSLIEGGDKNG